MVLGSSAMENAKMNIKVQRILIIRFGVLGDVILTTPVIQYIKNKFPDAKVDFLIKTKYHLLVKYHPAIDQIYTIEDNSTIKDLFATIKELNKNKYDLIIDLHANLRSFFVETFLNANYEKTYSKDIFKRRLLIALKINLFNKKKHVVERYLKTIDNNFDPETLPLPEIYTSLEIKQRVEQFLKTLNLKSDEILIGLNPGAIYFTKRWAVKKFVELGQLLLNQFNVRIFLLGGKEDKILSMEIAELLGEKAVVLNGDLNILEVFELIKHLRFVLTGDTGLMHLTCASRIPVIALFGPTVQEFGFWPYGEKNIILEKSISCRPCSLHGTNECPIGTHLCMENIEAEEVFNYCKKLLNLDSR